MLYLPPQPWSEEGSGHLRYLVAKTVVIQLYGLDFVVQQQVKNFSTYSYYYIVVRGKVTDQFQRKNGNGPETVYCLEPADPKYKPDLEVLLRKNNFRGHLEFGQFP